MERQWSELPRDILTVIAKRLETDEMDIRRLRAVCSSWRSSIASCKKYLYFDLKLPYITNSSNCPFLTLTRQTLLMVSPLTRTDDSSASPCIIQLERTRSNLCKLLHYPSREHEIAFPKLTELPRCINLLDYRITEVLQSYRLSSYLDALAIPEDPSSPYQIISKAITLADDNPSSFSLLALYGNGKLASWRLGAKKWAHLKKEGYHFADITCYKGGFYAVECGGRMMRFTPQSLMLEEVVTEPRFEVDWEYQKLHVLEFDGRLYLLTYTGDLNDEPMISLRVYVLNDENKTWDRAYDLSGGAFFVGRDCVFSISDKDFMLPERDAVYFGSFACCSEELCFNVPCSLVCDLYSNIRINNSRSKCDLLYKIGVGGLYRRLGYVGERGNYQ